MNDFLALLVALAMNIRSGQLMISIGKKHCFFGARCSANRPKKLRQITQKMIEDVDSLTTGKVYIIYLFIHILLNTSPECKHCGQQNFLHVQRQSINQIIFYCAPKS